MADRARIVIVGGGVIGLAVAYHLAEIGCSDVVLIERHALTSGTSWHAAGIVGPLRASLNLTRLASYATELFPALESKTGQSAGYRRTGGYWLARSCDRMTELARIARTGEASGLEVETIGPEALARRMPSLSTEGVAGALFVAADAQANPVDVCAAYARRARAAGIRILENTACAGFAVERGRVAAVILGDGTRLRCETVVNCGGAWARRIGAMAGVPVPLQAVEHMYVVTEPVAGLPDPYPIVRDLDRGIYLKGDAGKLVLGGFEPHAKPFDVESPAGQRPFAQLPEDWDQFEPFMTAGLALVPALGEAGIRHFMNGPESFTPDTRPLLGESPYCRGFFVAAGFNSTGMMSSAGAGRAMAEWIVDGAPSLDLWALDIARFDRASAARPYVTVKVEDVVADLFRMHWPYKQAESGRGVRRSAWHDSLAREGAVFGAPTGWERPLWFDRSGGPPPAPSYGPQAWWRHAEAEARGMAERVGLFDLSPFTKLDVRGRDALEFLQRLCGADLDVAQDRTVYTQMLNRAGGIEADVTVTRVGEHDFRIVSGAATRSKDFAWVARHAADWGLAASVFDATSAEAVLGLMGPGARALLQSLTDGDLSDAAFPFGASRRITVGMGEARATRLSFVGELGYELSVPTEFADEVLARLLGTGAAHGLVLCGHYALDGCRMEKGYRHWGHDIGPRDTPLEAGLGFALCWNKGDFLGRAAVEQQKREGVRRRLLHFAVEGARPLLLHDEPIFRDGRRVGLTTSGARGFRTGLALCLGYVACDPAETRADLLAGAYEIGVADERFPLRALAASPYDPAGTRMRG